MSTRPWTALPALLGTALLLAILPASAADPEARPWDQTVDRAVKYLRGSQESDGSWSGRKSPGITGIALTGLLRTGKVAPHDPAAQKALRFIEGLINPQAGHIAGKDARVQLQNYVTSVNVMALVEANR